MTQSTDAERAAFEAHFKCLDLTKEPDAWGVSKYKHDTVSLAWEAWQAARRAPAAPVPQGWPSAWRETIERAAEKVKDSCAYRLSDDLYAMLAAAPQPPEATPSTK